jgi:prepilin-type N-terminal cleavage/methylation domain-containing protein
MRRAKGFSLIELLIVVAIILIIAAIAIPNLIRARMSANDAAAAGSEHVIIASETGYDVAYPTIGYATMAQLGGVAPCTPTTSANCLIDNSLALATTGANAKSGYVFNVYPVAATATTPPTYYTTAAPFGSLTGSKSFCAADDGVLRYSTSTVAVTSYASCIGLTAQ